jgi:hypothetical protein
MKFRPLQPRRSLLRAALAVSLLVMGSVSACGTNTTTIEFIPSQVLAQFAVFSDTTETATGSTTQVYAGAIFWQGILTRVVEGGSVEVVAPGGTAYPMGLQYNPSGAAYYLVSLPSFELNSAYTFRVTLPSGTHIDNSVTSPQNALAVTNPVVGETKYLLDPLVVDWTGGIPLTTKRVAIVLRQTGAADFFSVVGAGRVQALDIGSYDGGILPVPITYAYAREAGDVGTGTRYLTVTRTETLSAGGFFAGSFTQASLISAIELVLATP